MDGEVDWVELHDALWAEEGEAPDADRVD